MTPIERAVEVMGSQSALAKAINKTPAEISQWVNGRRPIPATICRAIEKAVSGAVTVNELRPDVFGEPQRTPDEAA